MLRAAVRACLIASIAAMVLGTGFAAAATKTTWGAVKGKYHESADSALRGRTSTPNTDIMPEDPGPQYSSGGGDGQNLPVGSQYTDAQVLAWARTMPAVQQAMAEMSSRGYIAMPDQDAAHHWNSSGSYGSCAILSYRHDPTILSDTQMAMCFVFVVSKLNPSTGIADTRVWGGMLIIDRTTGAAYTADDVTAYADSDPSFDIEMNAGSGDSDPGIIRPGGMHVNTGLPTGGCHTKKTFQEYVSCVGQMSLGASIVTAGELTVTGGWAAMLAGGPWSFIGLGAAILAGSSVVCFG